MPISYDSFPFISQLRCATKTPPERDTTRPEGDSSHVPTHPKRTYNSPGGKKLASRLAESRREHP